LSVGVGAEVVSCYYIHYTPQCIHSIMDFGVNRTTRSYLKLFATEKNFRSTPGTVTSLCPCSFWSVGVTTQQRLPPSNYLNAFYFAYVVNTEQIRLVIRSQKHRPLLYAFLSDRVGVPLA